MPTITTDDNISLYYEVHGTGDQLVVINGLGSGMSEFQLTDILASHYQVLVLDNRGSGRSDKPDKPYTIQRMARDTIAVMQAAGFKHASILGISMGGRIALELTLSHSELVDKLILTSTCARTINHRGIRTFIAFKLLPRLPILKGKYPQPYYAYNRQRIASRSYDCTDRLDEIKKSVFITHGENDKTAEPMLAEELHQGIKGSQLQWFRGGHLFYWLGNRQAYIEALQVFLG